MSFSVYFTVTPNWLMYPILGVFVVGGIALTLALALGGYALALRLMHRGSK